MVWRVDGFPAALPPTADFYNLTNEDIGFTANLVTGTNDTFQYALPYPASMDLFNETIVVFALDQMFITEHNPDDGTSFQGLVSFLSALRRDVAATFRGNLADGVDEWFKAQFAGPLFFGRDKAIVTATAATEGHERSSDPTVHSRYFFPYPLRLLTPLYNTLSNQAYSLTLATNADADANFTAFEKVANRVWWIPSKLSRRERNMRRNVFRLQLLDS